MKLSRKIVMLASVLILSSCASTQSMQSMQEVQVPPERFVLKGYSFIPLNEKGWLVRIRNPHQVVMGKLGASADETIGIVARKYVETSPSRSSEEIVRQLEEIEQKNPDSARFKSLKREIVPYREKGITCAYSHTVVEDHAAQKRTARTGSMILDTVSLTCAHPGDNRTLVFLAYSQRNYPGEGDPNFLEKAKRILSSLEFSDL